MNSDKKQLTQYVVLIILVAVLAGYLGFTFLGKKPAPVQQAKATPAKSSNTIDAQSETNPSEVNSFDLSISPVGERRDPFTPAFCADSKPPVPKPESKNRPYVSRTIRQPLITTAPVPLPQLAAVPSGSEIQPAPPVAATPPTPDFRITGVIVGEQNVAVIRSSAGDRHVVREGQHLAGGYEVVSITKDGVVIKGKGRTLRIKLGGVNNAS